MRKTLPFQAWRAALAALAATCLISCGGGGGGTVPAGLSVSYSNPPGGSAGDVHLVFNSSSGGTTLVLDVVVFGPLSNAYSMAFHLQYDPALLKFVSASEGNTFDADNCNGGDCTVFTVNSTSVPDTLIVGLTRKSTGVGINIPSGANTAMRFTFRAVDEGGPSNFSFVSGTREIKSATGAELSKNWRAGSVTILLTQ